GADSYFHRALRRSQHAIDVVCVHDSAGKELQRVNLFVRAGGRGDRRELVTLVVGEGLGGGVDRIVPGDLVDRSILVTDVRVEDAIGVLEELVTPAARLAGVAMVDAALPEVRDPAYDAL